MVFKCEGWAFVEGESAAKKLTAVFDVTTDHRGGKYVATRINRAPVTNKIGIREAIEYLAYNDDEELGDVDTGFTTCVTMIAHLFDRQPAEIAGLVETWRASHPRS